MSAAAPVTPVAFQPLMFPRVLPVPPPVPGPKPSPNPPLPLPFPEVAPVPGVLPPDPSLIPTPPESETPTVRLTVDQVVNAVLVSDPRLRAGFEAINQANADALTASLKPNPTLFMDIQLLPLTRPFTVDAQGGPPQQDVTVSYPIDWFLFGKRAATMAAAAAGVRVSEADFADRVRLRVTEAVVAYYDVLEAQNLREISRQDVANLIQVETALQKAVEAGGRPVVELNRVRLDRLRAQQAYRDTETLLVTAKSRLRAMMGRTDADPNFGVAASLDVPLSADPPPSEQGFELAIRNRPDLEAARLRTAHARATLRAEKLRAYPELAPMFGYTRQYQAKAIGQPDANSWMAAFTMSLPLHNRNQGNRARAASQVSQFEYEYQAAIADLRAQVETAAQEYRAAKANAETVTGEQLKLARQVRDSLTAAYKAGGRTLLEYLDAERNFRDTYRAYVVSRAAYWRAVFRYGAVIGQQPGQPPK